LPTLRSFPSDLEGYIIAPTTSQEKSYYIGFLMFRKNCYKIMETGSRIVVTKGSGEKVVQWIEFKFCKIKRF
jgi:hypothetical protein